MVSKLKRYDFKQQVIAPIIAVLAVGGIGTYMVTKGSAYSYMSGVTPYSCTQQPTPTLRAGDSGDCVKALQYQLNQWIVNMRQPISKLKEIGKFDDNTEQAVTAFQRSVGLRPDGVVDELTWKKISTRSCIVSVNCGT